MPRPVKQPIQFKQVWFTQKGEDTLVGLFNRDARFPNIRPILDRFNGENETSLRVITPRTADFLLVESGVGIRLAPCSPIAVDQVVVYERPGEPLGQEVVYTYEGSPRIIFSVPRKFRGQRNTALVVTGLTSKDFHREGRDFRIHVNARRVIPVPEFPDSSGHYLLHPEATIPYGQRVNGSTDARHLWRRKGECFVGPAVRYAGHGYKRHVDTERDASELLAILVEITAQDAEKLKLSKKQPIRQEINVKLLIPLC
ncbi:hypothetical protein HY570_01225 [Candidatus Micrarchaeota archaeon]|nr:hypothetical protein [Candidatus Micrarchaeota archaeon]